MAKKVHNTENFSRKQFEEVSVTHSVILKKENIIFEIQKSANQFYWRLDTVKEIIHKLKENQQKISKMKNEEKNNN